MLDRLCTPNSSPVTAPSPPQRIDRIHMDFPRASTDLSASLFDNIRPTPSGNLVFLCIGTDRSTGDCLGPLIGTRLDKLLPAWCRVYGTLENPVHAANLTEVMHNIDNSCPDGTIIAIDACLGRKDSVGYINLFKGPLKPGTGVNKSLPPVGNWHITGVVNVGGFMEYVVLQNTRLSLVMRMSEIISNSLYLMVSKMNRAMEYSHGSLVQ